MRFNNRTIEQKILDSLTRAYEWLFKLAIYSGNWRDVRSTALVALCLLLRESRGSPWLTATKQWLLNQQTPVNSDMACWAEELWDTSMALMAIKRLGVSQKDPQFEKALKYILNGYNINGRHNWYDEPWETLWCVIALLETDASPEVSDICFNATKWLLTLQDANGRIVSPHYTGLFILASHRLQVREKNNQMLKSNVTKAVQYLLKTISANYLWTGEAWSNGQILWALTSTGNFPCKDTQTVELVLNWFFARQDSGWGAAEDTAYSILGLYYLLRELCSQHIAVTTSDLDTLLFTTLRREFETPVLRLKRKFVEHYADGTLSINISPRFRKILYITVATAMVVAAFITLWDFIKKLLEG